jgi:uncharacterized protein involved in outer membrane biogenesis
MAVDFAWQAEQLLVDDTEISKLNLPLTIANGRLAINGLSGELGGGSFRSEATLIKQGDAGVLNLDFNASDIVLEELKLLPPEELKKTVTGLSVTVWSATIHLN